MALAQDDRPAFWGRKQSSQGRFKIATIPLNQYKPEEISLDVDPEKITLPCLHRSENENGFENSEVKEVIKMPEGIDPTSVTSTPRWKRFTTHGNQTSARKQKRRGQKLCGQVEP